jgi:hypothetical protein
LKEKNWLKYLVLTSSSVLQNRFGFILQCFSNLPHQNEVAMSLEKENFLRTKLVTYLQRLDATTKAQWGKMSVQHMVEHLGGDAVRNANGRLKFDTILTPPDKLAAMREFLMSDKPFKENTNNPLMGGQLASLRYITIQAAIGALQQELIYFFEAYAKNTEMVIRNPFFGDLNFEQNVQLLYKHSLHHLRQFGVEPLTR